MTAVDSVPPAPASTAPPSKSAMQRIVGVFFSPGETFRDIARRPDVLVPLLILVVVSFITTALVVPHIDFETTIRTEMEKNPNMDSKDVDRIMRFAVASAKVIAYASPVLMIGILAIVAGALLIAFRMFAGEGTFKQAFSATLWAWFPLLIKSILTAVIAFSRGMVPAEQLATMMRSNPAFLVDMKAHPALFVLLSSVDIFTIWTLVLLVIGFAALSTLPKMRSAVIIVSLWIVVVLGRMGMASLAGLRAAKA